MNDAIKAIKIKTTDNETGQNIRLDNINLKETQTPESIKMLFSHKKPDDHAIMMGSGVKSVDTPTHL